MTNPNAAFIADLMAGAEEPQLDPAQTVAAEWARFEAIKAREGATPAELRNMRQAFFGGATFLILMVERLGAYDLTEEQQGAHFERLYAELMEFGMQEMQALYGGVPPQ